MNDRIEQRQRWLSGMPRHINGPWYRRMWAAPLTWLTLILIPFYAFALVHQYKMLHPDRRFPDGTVALGLNNEALLWSAYWAMWTALAWVIVFILVDRWRPQRWLVRLLAFGWGACASTFFSIHINSWAGQIMNTTRANSDLGSRAAVFVAPFVEEATKATVLFLLVILYRQRIVSRLNIAMLAGLSAVGFAFVENIIYYARAFVFVHQDPSFSDPVAKVMELVKLRGFYTSFGHPLFTIMTGFGLAIGLGARSKIVRVMAPLGGFMVAAAAHMLFNGLATSGDTQSLRIPWFFALALVGLMVVYMILGVMFHGHTIRRRLTDYHRFGWLNDRDPVVYSSLMRRFVLHLSAALRGPRMWWRTRQQTLRMTELAYLHDAMMRGVISDGALLREHELLLEVEQHRPQVLSDPKAQRIIPPLGRRSKAGATPQPRPVPQAPGPAGLAGQWPRS